MPRTPDAALEYVRDTARTRRPHSRLRSAAPPLPAGPPVGRCSCSEPASPNPPGRRGKMLKTCLKTKEKGVAAAGKPAALQGSPWSGAGRLDRTWEAEPTPTVSFNRSRPKPSGPASSPLSARDREALSLSRDSQSDANELACGCSPLQGKTS